MNIDQAYDMLKKAGVSESIRTLTVRRWIREGKIIDENTGDNRFIKDDKVSKRFYNSSTNQDKNEIIRQLKLKLKVKDEHIEGIEDLHEAGKKLLLLDRKKLNREIVILKNEKNNLQNEIENLLKENIELRNKLIKLKEKLYKEDNSDIDDFQSTSQSIDYRQKLGLSKMASNKEVLSRYKELLKINHPDRGGNEKSFHYIKTDYDNFKNSI